MQVASDLLTTALEAIVQALVLMGGLLGIIAWQVKRGRAHDPRDQLIKQLNEDIRKLAEADKEKGERISYLEGRSNGKPRGATPRH